jgi:hypothetical protein
MELAFSNSQTNDAYHIYQEYRYEFDLKLVCCDFDHAVFQRLQNNSLFLMEIQICESHVGKTGYIIHISKSNFTKKLFIPYRLAELRRVPEHDTENKWAWKAPLIPRIIISEPGDEPDVIDVDYAISGR